MPDVMSVAVSVVRMTSMLVAVLYRGSLRVGVVTVVCRLFSRRVSWSRWFGVRRRRS